MTSENVRIHYGDLVLAGTLHSPAKGSVQPIPALVMLQGSGPEDRESSGYFAPIRAAFLTAGLAVLSWDRPGVGESDGSWTDQTFFDRAREAEAGLQFLRARADIDARRTGIWGHSQGGWIGPLVASRDPELSFLIVNSGPGVNAHEQDLYGIEHRLRVQGASEHEIDDALVFMHAIHEAAQAGVSFEQVSVRSLKPAEGTAGGTYFGDISPELWRFLSLNAQQMFEPVDALSHISCPTLALFGEHDDLVPVARSVAIFERAFARPDAPPLTIRVFPRANHRIGVGDGVAFATGYLETMTEWLHARLPEQLHEQLHERNAPETRTRS